MPKRWSSSWAVSYTHLAFGLRRDRKKSTDPAENPNPAIHLNVAAINTAIPVKIAVSYTHLKKTPNEIALNTLLVGLTLIFLMVIVTLFPMGTYAGVSVSYTHLC